MRSSTLVTSDTTLPGQHFMTIRTRMPFFEPAIFVFRAVVRFRRTAPKIPLDTVVNAFYMLQHNVSAFVFHTAQMTLVRTLVRMQSSQVFSQILQLVENSTAQMARMVRISMHYHVMTKSAVCEILLTAQMTNSQIVSPPEISQKPLTLGRLSNLFVSNSSYLYAVLFADFVSFSASIVSFVL